MIRSSSMSSGCEGCVANAQTIDLASSRISGPGSRCCHPPLHRDRHHILAEQGQLAASRGNQTAGFFNDPLHRPREFRTAGIGHHTESAELVTAFLNRQKGGRPRGACSPGSWSNLISSGKSVSMALTRRRIDAADKLGKAVIGLRTDDNIDPGRTAGDFLLRPAPHSRPQRLSHCGPAGRAPDPSSSAACRVRRNLFEAFSRIWQVLRMTMSAPRLLRSGRNRAAQAHRSCGRNHRHSSGTRRS